MHRLKVFLSFPILLGTIALHTHTASAALLVDPNDPRSWQGASVGTFAQLYYGANTLANRQLVIDNGLLDDGIFNSAGFVAGSLVANDWSNGVSGGSHVGGADAGTSTDVTGVGGYDYVLGGNVFTAANSIDNRWFQSSNVVGETVFDSGFQASRAAVFNTIDHAPLPQEAIESTVYLSNNLIDWTPAVTQRVWLEGFNTILGIQWDGFVYAVGTGTADTFRYASVIWGGPGALQADGDNEINGIMGLRDDFGQGIPEPATMTLLGLGSLGVLRFRKKRNTDC